MIKIFGLVFFFFSSRRRHTRSSILMSRLMGVSMWLYLHLVPQWKHP